MLRNRNRLVKVASEPKNSNLASKRTNLHLTTVAQKDVVGLDITVDAMHRVDIDQRLENLRTITVSKMQISTMACLFHREGDLFLRKLDKLKLLQHVCQAAAAHELHHHPELLAHNVRVNVVDNIRVVAGLHNADLSDDQLCAVTVEGHLLHSKLLAITGVRREHFTSGTASELAHVGWQSENI